MVPETPPLSSLFSYEKLSAFLEFISSTYGVFSLQDETRQTVILLRHDVDLDIGPAYELSKIEENVGVRSSFFFLVTGDTYNVQSARNRRILREMAQSGFDVGLHFDPTIYPATDLESMTNEVNKEGAILSDVIGRKVSSVSLHNPSVHGQYPIFPGWRNAYDPKIFTPETYLSDSRMTFRQDPEVFLERARHQVVQLLLHPLHYSREGDAYPGPMVRYLAEHSSLVRDIFMVNSTFAALCKDTFYDELSRAVQELAKKK